MADAIVPDIRRMLPHSNVVDVLHRAPSRVAAWKFLRGLKGARRVKHIRMSLNDGADRALKDALDQALKSIDGGDSA